MIELYQKHIFYLENLEVKFSRDLQFDIDWSDRLIFIRGARGSGKSTLILQHIKKTFSFDDKALYVSMDDIIVSSYSLINIATYHFNHGGTHLFIDEIHKYKNWSQELKNIYDTYKKYHVVISGSSILQIHQGNADLSRRVVTYELKGLSLREFINIETGESFSKINLEEILKHHVEIASEITKKINPLKHQKEYLEYGFYPYYLESKNTYTHKLSNTINLALEQDLPQLMSIDLGNVIKIKKLIHFLCNNVPFQPNLSKLAVSFEINRQTLNSYLYYLNEASILKILWSEGKAYSLLSKPEKIYLHNTNVFYIVNKDGGNVGTMRETFFLSQVSNLYQTNLAKIGDFILNGKYTFEVGGMGKDYTQIPNLKNSFIAADEILIGVKNKIPLWLFGFVY